MVHPTPLPSELFPVAGSHAPARRFTMSRFLRFAAPVLSLPAAAAARAHQVFAWLGPRFLVLLFAAMLAAVACPLASAQTPLAFQSTGALPGGAPNLPYGTTLQVNGGQGPFTFTITSMTLPAGLTLNASTGHISGTPSTVGSSSFTAKVTDSLSAMATGNFSISIANLPASTAPQLALLTGRYAAL